MSKLIALVATAVVVNGERTVIQPGEPLPDLHEHDSDALLKSGAAADPREDEAAKRAADDLTRFGQAEFQAARERLQGEAESIAAPPAQAEQNPPPPPPPPPPPRAPAPATGRAKKS